ncbi:MAG: hypothetical protein CMH12_23930 [Maritimibacter sp.]|nr:hypothetical protein [Maritimibacter sp.]
MRSPISAAARLAPLVLAVSLSSAAFAAPDIEARVQSTSISFAGGQNFSNAVLTVTGPDGYTREESATRGMPIFRLQTAGRLVDGYYQFALTAATDEVIPLRNKMNNGRGPEARTTEYRAFNMSGAFRVQQGLIVPIDETAGEGADTDATE